MPTLTPTLTPKFHTKTHTNTIVGYINTIAGLLTFQVRHHNPTTVL